jgi:hypothetical protein
VFNKYYYICSAFGSSRSAKNKARKSMIEKIKNINLITAGAIFAPTSIIYMPLD